METRANYVVIGAFTLAAVVGAFLFVMWIAGYTTPGGHRTFQVVFNGSVSGLSNGANVNFNGIKVGEVTHLTFSRSDPHQVVADIDVSADAPIDRNTKARLETAGITGAAAVALLGGSTPGAPLVGENGQGAIIYAEQSMQLQEILDNVGALSIRATAVLDDAEKVITDNSAPIHSAIENAEVFSKALADNAPGIDAALKSVGELGKQIGPLAARLQTLSDDADRVVQAIDPAEVRAIVDNVQSLSAKGVSVVDRADKLLADNSDSIHSTLQSADVFAKTLADNAPNVDVTLKNLAEISKTVQPVVAQIQTLSENANRLIAAVDPDKVRDVVGNVQTFSQSLAASSDNFKGLVRDGAALANHLNDSAKRLDTALVDVDRARQPGVERPCPPDGGEHEHPAQESTPGRMMDEEARDLGDREHEDEVEEQFEGGDLVLVAVCGLSLGIGHRPSLSGRLRELVQVGQALPSSSRAGSAPPLTWSPARRCRRRS